jgi:hypothetical protein
MIFRAIATAALAASLIMSGSGASHGAARPSGHRVAAAPAGVMLAAGDVGPRSAVPWRLVGPGWVLAQYSASTPSTARPTTLYLVNPRGGRYSLYTWPASKRVPTLFAWSGDKARALFFADTPSPQTSQIVLATGRVENIPLPAAQGPIGYTMPDGLNLLTSGSIRSRLDEVVRFNLAGKLQKVLARGLDFYAAVDNPNGATLAVSGDHGLELVSNLGRVIRRLPLPASGSDPAVCVPARWWASGTILASCPSGVGRVRLWLVPASGAAPTALTPAPGYRGPELGDAWRLRSGLYLQAGGPCVFIGRQVRNGSVTQVNVPGSLSSDDLALAANGARLLVQARTFAPVAPCGALESLLWFNPATHAEQWLFKAPPQVDGVLAALAYGRPNG